MITHQECDTLFIADTLKTKFPVFMAVLMEKLDHLDIRKGEISGTNDIWCRDYMPVQISLKKFIQFNYPPPYLQSPEYFDSITDVDAVCNAIGITTGKSDLILDGGNIVSSGSKAIITDRVFTDNKNKRKVQIIDELQATLGVNEIIIIPHQPHNLFGHADGMLRFIDDDTVLVNDFSYEKDYFRNALSRVLKKHSLQQIEFTYSPTYEKNEDKVPSASGTYVNYLQVGNKIIMPTFGIPEDECAQKQLREVFPQHQIETIDSTEIAKEGGVLNCIVWNVKYWKLILQDLGDYYLVMNA
jgi:agmatine deiminase